MTHRRRPSSTREAPLRGGSPTGAAAAAHGSPVTGRLRSRRAPPMPRPPAVDLAISLVPSALEAAKMSQPSGRNAARYPGRPLQRQGIPEIVSDCFAETISGIRP